MQWLAVDPARTIHGSCDAPDVREARVHLARVLQRHPGAWVMSAASYDCGDPKPLPAPKCHACGVRDKMAGYSYCGPCEGRRRRERKLLADQEVRDRAAEYGREWRKRQKALQGKGGSKARIVGGVQVAAAREDHIRRGIDRRAAKRQATQAHAAPHPTEATA